LADAYDNVPGEEPAAGAKDQAPVMPAPMQPGNSADAANEPAQPADSAATREPKAIAPQATQPSASAPAKIVLPVQEDVAPPPLTKQLMMLRSRVRSVLKGYYRKQLNSRDNDPWETMHGMLAYGVQSRIHQNGPNGDPITSVGWLCYNKPCKGQTLMYVNPQ